MRKKKKEKNREAKNKEEREKKNERDKGAEKNKQDEWKKKEKQKLFVSNPILQVQDGAIPAHGRKVDSRRHHDSRSNPFEERGNDADHGGPTEQDAFTLPSGPITRSKSKEIQKHLNGLIQKFILAQPSPSSSSTSGANIDAYLLWNVIQAYFQH